MAASRQNGGSVTSVHLTESCDEDQPRLITHVETSLAGKGDVDVTPVIHQALKDKELLPKEHLTDTNYAESKQFVASQLDYGIDLIAPTRADNKWQGQARQGFAASSFQLDWHAQKATCPTGHESSSWTPAIDRRDNEVIKIKFSSDRLSTLFLPFSVYSNGPTNRDA
jgi:transposase